MKDFFISYNSADRGWATWIAWQLEETGYTTILQAWDFRPGSNFVLAMQRAAREAERTIAVLSPSYLEASFTHPEWAAAFVQDPTGVRAKLLPVRVADCDLKGLLPAIIYVDLVGLDEEQAQQALLEGSKRGRAKPQTAPGFPGVAKVMRRIVSRRPTFPQVLVHDGEEPSRRWFQFLLDFQPWPGCLVRVAIAFSVLVTLFHSLWLPSLVSKADRLNYYIVLDATGNMEQSFDSTTKWTVGKDAVYQLLNSHLPRGANYGLVIVGGATEKNSESDQGLQPLVPLRPGVRKKILREVDDLDPQGTGSLSEAIRLAVEELSGIPEDEEKTLITITGGTSGYQDESWPQILEEFQPTVDLKIQ